MKRNAITIALMLVLFSCKSQDKQEPQIAAKQEEKSYSSFGGEVAVEESIDRIKMRQLYENLAVGDSVDVTFNTDVNSVCKKKGCWMKLDLAEGEEIMVKFRDYGFFVPKDLVNEEVIVQGKAYITEVPVQELKHYAEDAGKSEAENCSDNRTGA
ncbi:DUF4920 domain-containing protein [Salegentibacter sp. F188]|uniref:DUF4920 domain-containing protein n=1 Tax=Autumnicola patrickiae TaxID=3075591 RepID=A0ABU3E1G8_9FLAO|nr:DUF4920 domain-containing protein [Salegentibacter sp. F188]MDT0689534.1 DUF4920 domain-containing protein [Salegentibacter sp. F188]